MKAATRLYESGAVRTKAEAADAVGLSRGAMYVMTSPKVDNPHLKQLREEIDGAIADRTIDMSVVLALLGRRALTVINEVMEESDSDGLRLKAAQDLADRSPETSKTIKAAVANVNISGADAKELASALVRSARVKEKYAHVAEGDFVRVNTDEEVETVPEDTEQPPDGDDKWKNKISRILQKT
jgi:hypothetical protein